ncbi:MAG: acyl-CoA dehydrogenase family protein [Clostridiales Family XIII bacterium]|jgi:alkylation response protein AidB-like acyl-CoA dehydrogenase|nr:acyl-CoA dehydrogenase family protein [Clostridiales Family XIII bacterium]
MDFQLTQEQIDFQMQIREFAKKEIAPGAIERDESEDFAALYDILINKMGPMGLLGLTFPKEYGGAGKTHVDFALAMMELCKVDVSVGASWSVSLSLGTVPIYLFGNESQKQKYLVPSAQGKCIPAFGLTEENAGSDSAMQETTAVLDGDEYVLNGKKIYITNASYAEFYIIMAMTDKSKGTKGISSFIVEKDRPGLSFDNQFVKMGIRSTVQTEVIMKDCRIPKENLIGEEGKGFKIAMTALDVGRLGVAGQGVGAAWGAMNMAARYAKERKQFGKPIFDNQAVSFMLADMGVKVELAKLMLLKACWLCDQGLPFSKEAAMAKMFCTDTAMQVTTDAVQIFGGKGFLRENEVERFMRDSKILQIYEGTNQVQRMIVANHVAKEANE